MHLAAERLRRVAKIAGAMSGALELDAVLEQVTAALGGPGEAAP